MDCACDAVKESPHASNTHTNPSSFISFKMRLAMVASVLAMEIECMAFLRFPGSMASNRAKNSGSSSSMSCKSGGTGMPYLLRSTRKST